MNIAMWRPSRGLRLAWPLLLMVMWLLPSLGSAASLLFVTTSPITPGKFQVLSKAAEPYGLKVEAKFVEKLGVIDNRLWAGHDMVLFDAPRDHIQEAIAARVKDALPALAQAKTPVLWLHTSKPQWQNLPDDLAKRLHAYYVNGGRTNNAGFFATVAAHLARKPLPNIAPPQVFPATAIYHPKAPSLVFPDTASYLRWKGDPKGKPVIAIAFHQQAIAAEQTGMIDDFIARIEAAGAVPLAYYSPVMDNNANTATLAPDGKPVADVLITTQIMLNPEGRRTEFEKLGIPVIQAMSYRKGNADAWWNDSVGISLMDVPFYLAQPEFAGVHDVIVASAADSNDQLQAIPEQSEAVVGKALALARWPALPMPTKKWPSCSGTTPRGRRTWARLS